ncbi:MAG: serine--tRNA ligase, partial [Burkholderiales bacterium]|nr:serine--tRNA ligase [Burkholderiales bacterium]
MIDISLLRKDLPSVIARLQTRKNPQTFLNVEAFQALEAERKTQQIRTEELQNQRNTLSRQIGQLKAKGEDAAPAMAQVTAFKAELDRCVLRLEIIQSEMQA